MFESLWSYLKIFSILPLCAGMQVLRLAALLAAPEWVQAMHATGKKVERTYVATFHEVAMKFPD